LFCKLQRISEEEIITIRLTEHTTCGDLFGKLYPNLDPSNTDLFVSKEGPITKGVKNGSLIIIQGLDKADGSVS